MSARTDFWLGDTDTLPLALYRVGFGLLLALECLTRLPYATELYSSEGFHRSAVRVWVPPPTGAFALVLVAAFGALAIALGWRTRVASLVTLGAWGWLHAIDQINEKALHSVMLVILALLALSDAGAVFSLDARRRGRARGVVWATPLRLLQLHFAQIYFFAAIGKLFAPGWVQGTVLDLSLSSRWATDIGLWVASWIPNECVRLLALLTIVYEMVGPWLLFVRWARPWVIAFGVCFHLGIQATLAVGWLGAHFILALLTLYPETSTLRAVWARLPWGRWESMTTTS